MAKVQYEEMFPWELAQTMAEAPICYLPLGVLEWHGEHNALGLDAIKAHAICTRAARISGGVVVPPLYWATDEREDLKDDGTYLTGGVERGERYHVPGNMFWLRPETYLAMLLDIYEAMLRRGFRVIMVVSGHWSRGTLPTIRASGEQFLAQHPEMKWLLLTDQEVVPDLHYPHEHAAGGETSILMALRPELVDLSKTFETDKSLKQHYAKQPEHLQRRQETSYRYIGVLLPIDDGSNDPELTASVERGQLLLEVISERIAEQARKLLADQQEAQG